MNDIYRDKAGIEKRILHMVQQFEKKYEVFIESFSFNEVDEETGAYDKIFMDVKLGDSDDHMKDHFDKVHKS